MTGQITAFRSVGEGWADYEETVLPETAGEIQRRETRRAFYAGARVFQSIAIWHVASLDDDKAEDALQKLDAELCQFAAAVRDGKR